MQFASENRSYLSRHYKNQRIQTNVTEVFHRLPQIHLQQQNDIVFRSAISDSWCPCDGTCPKCIEAKNHAKSVQTKLKISRPDDAYEQEADRMAEIVMRRSASDHINPAVSNNENRIDRKCSACEMKKDKEDEENLDIRRKTRTVSKPETSDRFTDEISNMRFSGGSPLDDDTKEFMESKFGYDFSGVRIHTDTRAAESAQSVEAFAYTIGQDIVFGANRYIPGTDDGYKLLAHELTHVIQQTDTVRSTASDRSENASPVNQQESKMTTQAGRAPVVLQRFSQPIVMRTAIFNSTIDICHRVLKSRVFHVSEGGLVVVANPSWEWRDDDTNANAKLRDKPTWSDCGDSERAYNVSLTKKGWWDREYGSCEFPIGLHNTRLPVSRLWSQLAEGDYYLTIWHGDTNPSCCLRGDIVVSQYSQLGNISESCKQAPPGPLEILHDALNIAGLFPVLGVIADTANAGIYIIQGNYVDAGISAAAMIPVFGAEAAMLIRGERKALAVEKIMVKGEVIERLGRDKIAAGLKEARAAEAKAAGEIASATGKPPLRPEPTTQAFEPSAPLQQAKVPEPTEPVKSTSPSGTNRYAKQDLDSLRKAARTDRDAALELQGRYRNMSDSELLERIADKGDETARAVLSEKYPENAANLEKIAKDIYRPPHGATATLRRGGVETMKMDLKSGGLADLPAEERALKFPKNIAATHTERWAIRKAGLQAGDVLTIIGQYNPCKACQNAMQEAASRTGATIRYWWQGGRLEFKPKP